MEPAPKLSKRELKIQKFKEYKKKQQKDQHQIEGEKEEECQLTLASKRKEDSGQDENLEQTEIAKSNTKSKDKNTNKAPVKREKNKEVANKKYIVFVGNLSFKATKEQIETHFKSCEPTSIRLMTDKNTGKSKGFAFLEFQDAKCLEKALKYHHTTFQYRKINVELSAGGGGHSENRKRKIQEKNERLQKEREKHFKTKVESKGGNKKPQTKSDGDDAKIDDENMASDPNLGKINPERLKMLR